MKQHRLRPLLTVFVLGILAGAPAHAANEGRAMGVDPAAAAEFNGGSRTLAVGSDISLGERIVTGVSGEVQVLFVDQTRLVVGPGSALLIEAYLMRGNGSAEQFAINALGGTYRFITGNSPKSAYQINTPVATIGVRGTEFDLLVAGGETRVLLYDGAVRICNTGGSCVELTERCDIGLVTSAGTDVVLHNDTEHPPLVALFRYARVQSPLLPPFRISGAGNCLIAPEGSTDSIVNPNDDNNPRQRQTPQPQQPPPVPAPRPNTPVKGP